MEKGLTTTQKTNLPSLLQPNTVIREQPNKPSVLAHVSSLLLRIAKKYQIPNFDEESAVILAEDTIERFQYEPIETVIKCLELPPHTGEKNWRLTPDTIAEWMAITLEREAEAREKELSKEKGNVTFDVPADTDLSKETKQMIQDYINSLQGVKMVQAMTDADVKKYGKERYKEEAKSVGYVPPNKEYLIEKELRRRWINECYDAVTGKPLENWLSFEEYKLL
jgi:hypothetical protein